MREGGTGTTADPGREPGDRLVERELDLAIVAEAVTEAARGGSALVVIEGPAGIGKTRLLTEGRRLARDVGVRALLARASELESEFAFGVVRQLFGGALDEEGLLLPERAIAEAGAILNGPLPAAGEGASLNGPLQTAAEGQFSDASFAILHALHRLTVTLASQLPLAIVVDDLHWCDEPSLRFLNYLIRRLEGLRLAVLCTVRPREERARSPLVSEIAADPLARSVRPRPLSGEATALLVSDGLRQPADSGFSAACHTATGGNPLLLRELISTLQIESVSPDSDHVSAVADLGPRAVSRAVLVRLGRLSDHALRLARAASVVQIGTDLSLLGALAELEQTDAAAAARALVAAEILSDDAEPGFIHPLVGAAVYEDMPALDRSLAHERAAWHLHERARPVGTVAVHLALAPGRGQEWVCDVLADAARESLRAGSPASAIRYLTRALSEPPPPEHRAQLLLELGSAEAMLYRPSAVAHLTEAFEHGTDIAIRGAAAMTLARTLVFHHRVDESTELVRRAIAELDPGTDLRLGLEALEIMSMAWGPGEHAVPARLEHRLAPGEGVGAKMLAAAVSRQRAYAGGSAEECTQLALDALRGGDLMAADSSAYLAGSAILTLVRADRSEADGYWEARQEQARTRGSLAAKAAISLWRGYAWLRRGELDDAQRSLQNAFEEDRLIRTGPASLVHHAFLSAVLRERGDFDGARRVIRSVDAPDDASEHARYWLDSLAELLLVEERFDEAYAVATDLERRFAFLANPFDTPARSHRALALYHLGRREEGLALAAEALELARRWGAPGTLARGLRVLGTLERGRGLDHLRDAVDASEGSIARLEHAKALVAFGTALRLSRRTTDAREPLRRGLELAEALGAKALLARARHELHAAGGRRRSTAPAALTPSERRVVERAAAGQSNRAIAEALFVTTKTVELHLRNAYRKLGVRSRGELAGALDEDPVDADRNRPGDVFGVRKVG